MTKQEKVEKVLNRSVFTMIPPSEHAAIIEISSLVTFAEGSNCNEKLKLDTLYTLLEGKVDFVDKENGLLSHRAVLGRSFELETLLKSMPKWKTEWMARSHVELLAIPFEALKAVLKGTEVFTYLERIVISVEIQKFKNDLRLLGVKQLAVQNIISNLKITSDIEEIPDGSLVIISDGEIKAELLNEGRTYEIRKFCISDFFIYSKKSEYHYDFSMELKVWWMDEAAFKLLVSGAQIFKYLDILEQRKYEIVSASNNGVFSDSVEEEPEEEDDGLAIDAFYSDVPISTRIKCGRPVHFRQYDQMDCGAACMAMISHFYRKRITIPTWRSIIHVTREGASMLAVKNGATHVGFQAIGIMSGVKSLHRFRTPFIALMSYHYVVVYKVTNENLLIADPSKGLVVVTIEEFEKDFSRNCLLLKPTEKLLDFPESTPAYQKYFYLFKDIAFDFSVIAIFSVILFILSMAPPLFSQFIFDQVLKTGNTNLLNRVGLGVLTLTLFMACSSLIRAVMLSRMTNSLGTKLSALFFRHALRLPFNYFAVRNVGDITTRVQELEKIRNFMSHQLIDIFINTISIVLYATVFYFYDVRFFWLAIGSISTLFLLMTPLFKAMVKINQELFHSVGKNHSIAFEQFRGIKTIQAMSAQVQARWKWEETYDQILKIRDRLNRSLLGLLTVNSIAQQLIVLAFLFLAVRLFMKGELTLGQVVAVAALSGSMMAPVVALVQSTEQVSNVKVSFEKLDEIMTSPVEAMSERMNIEKTREEIEFKNIWFQYGSDLSPWVLKGVDLKIRTGEKIGLVGPSGSGKSTLAHMINLIYTPTKGEILIGGRSNTQIGLSELRSRVSVILQDNAIFADTVLNNIAFGEEFPNPDRAIRAAKLAEAHEFITKLPLGYSTLLGDGKKELSGGQKQRISIARAIYCAPEILILDEATSALDSITEKKVLINLQRELADTTCFTIAHRLNTIINSDRILVVNNGKIAEEGTHEELMKMQGIYLELFRKQVNL